MDAQFTDDEKRFILSEMIKQSRLDVDILVNLVKGFKEFEPDWLKMPLPHALGRTVNQCLAAADAMFQTTVERPNLKRKSMGELQEVPSKRRVLPPSPGHSTQPSTLTPAAQLPAPSLLNQSSLSGSAQHVNIRPRPPRTGPPALGETQLVPAAKRRGRPSRADKAKSLRPVLPQLAPRTEPPPQAPHVPGNSTSSMSGVAGYPHGHIQTPAASRKSFSASPGPQTSPKLGRKRGRPSNADKVNKAASPPNSAPVPDALDSRPSLIFIVDR
ncbi:hypothetical protein D7B24_004866 [Verticillium nonalfalfae]|uniref:Uncharacterized protein n=1 Tax=Verticillium nonalfalfae TaxID=1051616 RepID=A0A3M9XVD9_9PEZI|nr:uncharacterized protein D7B24_004866 [Verticillium nonalfalfae]RNJ51964.1 hypothetical protein D7B24_004866 [Verticillium nonalfalfae]